MLDQLITELLGQIYPVENYPDQIDQILKSKADGPPMDLMEETVSYVRMGSAYLYAGALVEADQQFMQAIANVQTRADECSEDGLMERIYVCALIGRFLHAVKY